MVEVTRLEPGEKKGLVVVITGHGKGKTTTALTGRGSNLNPGLIINCL